MQDKVPTRSQPAASDEIDIREVFAAIGRFFSRIGNAIVLSIIRLRRASRKYAWLLLAGAVLGAGIGYYIHTSFDPYYSSQLNLRSNYYSREMMASAIGELDLLAEEGNHNILAQKLSIRSDQASKIRSISVIPTTTAEDEAEIETLLQSLKTTEELTEEQLENLRERLAVTLNNHTILATVYDVEVLDDLQKGIYSYLQDNEYVRRRVAVEQENLLALRDKLRREQEGLDRLKNLQADVYGKITENSRTGSNNVILGTPDAANNPLNVYVQDLEFSREMTKINKRLELNRGLEIVNGFTPYGRPASLSLPWQLFVGALIGIGIAYLIILLISINNALNRYEYRHLASKSNL